MATTRTSTAKSRTNGSNSPGSEDFEKQFEQLRSDISTLSDTIQQMGAGKVHEAQRKATETGHDLTDAYEGALESVRGEFQHLEKDVTDKVRANPLQALGIAAGIGFLAAILSRR